MLSDGARGSVEIWGIKGGIAVPISMGERLSQAHYLYRDTDARSRNHCYGGKKEVLNICNLCLYSYLTILHEKRMRRSILCVVFICPAVQNFFTVKKIETVEP